MCVRACMRACVCLRSRVENNNKEEEKRRRKIWKWKVSIEDYYSLYFRYLLWSPFLESSCVKVSIFALVIYQIFFIFSFVAAEIYTRYYVCLSIFVRDVIIKNYIMYCVKEIFDI